MSLHPRTLWAMLGVLLMDGLGCVVGWAAANKEVHQSGGDSDPDAKVGSLCRWLSFPLLLAVVVGLAMVSDDTLILAAFFGPKVLMLAYLAAESLDRHRANAGPVPAPVLGSAAAWSFGFVAAAVLGWYLLVGDGGGWAHGLASMVLLLPVPWVGLVGFFIGRSKGFRRARMRASTP